MSKGAAGTFFGGLAKGLFVLLTLAVFPLVAIGLAFSGLPVMGIDWFEKDEVVVAPPPEIVAARAEYTETPASRLFESTLSQLGKVWQPGQYKVKSAGLPRPFDCVRPAPSLSYSEALEDDSSSIQVTLAAYPAGVGREAMSRLKDVASCGAGSAETYFSDKTGLGSEVASASVYWASNKVSVTFFRLGDVVAFVATDIGVDSFEKAREVETALLELMVQDVCPDLVGSDSDLTRNPVFAGADFTGKVMDQKLKTKKLKKPDLSEELQDRGVVKTPIPAPLPDVTPVDLPSADYPYPLWPPLPTIPAPPAKPEVPAKQKLKSDAEIRIEDPEGPGCGWGFLESAPSFYDLEIVQADNVEIVEAAQKKLDNDGKRWRKDILDYWAGAYEYNLSIYDYEVYQYQVESVRAAWEKIHQAWDIYYTAYANWQIEEQKRLDFIAAKDAAKVEWQNQKDACVNLETLLADYDQAYLQWSTVDYPAYEAELAQYNASLPAAQAQLEADLVQYEADMEAWKLAVKEWRKAGKSGPKPVAPVRPELPAPPVAPVAPVRPTLDHPCPPVKPEILGQKAPERVEPPKKPADPRPAGERN